MCDHPLECRTDRGVDPFTRFRLFGKCLWCAEIEALRLRVDDLRKQYDEEIGGMLAHHGHPVEFGDGPHWQTLAGAVSRLCLRLALAEKVAAAAALEHKIIKNYVLAVIMGETTLVENVEDRINVAVDAMNTALAEWHKLEAKP